MIFLVAVLWFYHSLGGKSQIKKNQKRFGNKKKFNQTSE